MDNLFNRITVLMLAVFLVAGCGKSSAIEIGKNAPDFTLTDINGKKFTLLDCKGEVIILDFFADWCPPCRQEIPDFIKLQDTYSAKGFTVIGVALVGLKDAKDFASRMGINYPVLIDDGKASLLYGPVRAIPTTFVIGKDAKIARMYIGFRSKETFEADVKELLDK